MHFTACFWDVRGFWINQWLQIPVNMNLSTHNKGRKHNAFRNAYYLYIWCKMQILPQKLVVCPWELKSHKKHVHEEVLMEECSHWIWEHSSREEYRGVSIVPVGLLGHRSFLIHASRHTHKREIFVPSIFFSFPFLFFPFFEASIVVLRVLVLIPVNDYLPKTEVKKTHAFLMGKAG